MKTFVISLGGSLIVPEDIDAKFLKKFKILVLRFTKQGHRFVIITGGGRITRKYQTALKAASQPQSNDLDWMGIYATWLNANLLRLMFGSAAHGAIVIDPNHVPKTGKKIIIAGGWKPGRSTDDDAVRLAKAYQATLIINLTNVDFVYTKDPRKYNSAKKIESISWKELRKIVGSKWNPGAHVPFDPVAASFAEKNNLRVIIANGKNLKNLENILNNKKFIGTEIE